MSKAKDSAVWAAVLGAAASTVLAAVLGWIAPVWDWVVRSASSFWRYAGEASGMPNWAVYVLVLIAAHSLIRSVLRLLANRKDNFRRYRQDNLFGALWRWEYMSDGPAGLLAYCSRCKLQLTYSTSGGRFTLDAVTTSLHCERCATKPVTLEGNHHDMLGRVRREVVRKIETGEWRAAVDAQDAANGG
jgi:hypothetical protein